MCFVLYSWSKGKRHANNIPQERQYVMLFSALSVKGARVGRREKCRFIKIKQHKKFFSVLLQNSQKINLTVWGIIPRNLPIYCWNYKFFQELEKIVSLASQAE